MLVTRLRDVEQQLSRATATVQIHIKAESASLGDRSGVGDGDASSAQAAADVRALNRGGDSDETETEDEMEELEGKAETVTSEEECATQGEGGKVSSPSSSCAGIAVVHDVVSPKPLPKRGPKDTGGGARSMGIMPPAERAVVSAIPTRLQTYIQTAKNAKQALGADDEAEHQRAEALVKSMQDRAVKATKQFLSWLLVEKVNAEMAVAFSEATALMVSVVIANDCNNRRGWIERMLKNFINIVKLTKGTTLDENLLGVEESRLQLRKYCDERFPDYVEDMQRYIQLQESRGLSAGQFQNPIRGLLRQFYEDCIDYSSKQDAVDGKPRTEERWNCVAKIGNILTAWIEEVTQAGGVLFVKDAPRIQSAMRRFETRFPGRIPAAFLA
ncbi:hypothetical protein BBJ28_00019427 [Nothophytophthora sp. Chile5]|nr:hypothetical protein BBJ28_00019427 [Nothophytophthora sp. Chile5]